MQQVACILALCHSYNDLDSYELLYGRERGGEGRSNPWGPERNYPEGGVALIIACPKQDSVSELTLEVLRETTLGVLARINGCPKPNSVSELTLEALRGTTLWEVRGGASTPKCLPSVPELTLEALWESTLGRGYGGCCKHLWLPVPFIRLHPWSKEQLPWKLKAHIACLLTWV